MTDRATATARERVPGEQADAPQQVPAKGWLQIAKRGWAEAKDDQVPLLAAGVAFYAFLAIFPALIAAVLIYGLVADPSTISAQINALPAIPGDAKTLIENQLTNVSATQGGGAVVGAILPILLALWSASGGMGNLMTAISTAYDEKDERGFVKKRALALALTLGAIVFMLAMLALVAVFPVVIDLFPAGPLRWVLQVVRWVVLAALIAGALAVLYRYAPDRDAPKMRWTSVGAAVATVLWIVASIGFSIYAGRGGYANTYGAVAGIVVLLFWLWITAYAILLGAEMNAEAEQQTAKDTTTGPEQPMGTRGAVKADSLPGDPGPDPGAEKSASRTQDAAAGSSAPENASHKEKKMSANAPETRPGGSTGSDRSLSELVTAVSTDLTRLVRDELRLAQAEVTVKAKKAGLGIGAFGAAGVLAVFAIGVLLAAAVLGLATVLPAWAAALIVGVLVLVVAGVAALLGKKKVAEGTPPVPKDAIDSVKTDVTEIKETIKR